MQMTDIILKKRNNEELLKDEISYFIDGYVKGTIPDYQVSALLMAIVFNGMSEKEVAALTFAMMNSGDVIDLTSISGIKVDKHSTGGVGDKTSLVLGPLVASCGAKVAKMSGRGLGHTGGTLDKLESIPGFQVEESRNKFIKQVNEIGMAIVGQSANLVPADKKMYALRDVTGTVQSVPLIASSIMSKKLATGSDAICLDVKFGSGAFCKDSKEAKILATAMVKIGDFMKKDTRALLTNMDQPLGKAIGNILEVKEAIETLKGEGPQDLIELCLQAGSVMLMQAKITDNQKEAIELLKKNLKNGKAFEVFKKFVKYQKGDLNYIEDTSKFGVAENVIEVKSPFAGYIAKIDTQNLGLAAMNLGAGREKKEDKIDYQAGIIIEKKCGDYVEVGDILAVLHTNHKEYNDEIRNIIESFHFKNEKVDLIPIVYDIIY
ncbi:MAG: pyrimidine-nucleoside phosphorylase [Bacilli bacterium]|nr:pyrimidine-nucleoside phosphorylase [Bacilli bacterium]